MEEPNTREAVTKALLFDRDGFHAQDLAELAIQAHNTELARQGWVVCKPVKVNKEDLGADWVTGDKRRDLSRSQLLQLQSLGLPIEVEE